MTGNAPAGATPAHVLLSLARGRLQAAGLDSALLEARLLLAHVLGAPPESLLAEPNRPVSAGAQAQFDQVLQRRLSREPLFYIIGEREFYGLAFQVDARALIPRPETELLIEEVLQAEREAGREPPDGAGLWIADIGTGSGCVAVALATVLPKARLVATDISADALQLARVNATRHGVAERVSFKQGDLLTPLPGPMDIIVANPPYIPAENLPTLQPEIRDFEPRVAVNGGDGGMTIAERLLRQAPPFLRRGGRLFMEVGYGQASVMVDTARAVFPRGAEVDMALDLAGIPRVVRVRQPE